MYYTYSIFKKNIALLKLLIDLGVHPGQNDGLAFKQSLFEYSEEVFDYLVNFDIPYEILCNIFMLSITDYRVINRYERSNKLLKKGINMHDIQIKFTEHSFGSLTVESVKFLMDNGFVLESNHLLQASNQRSEKLIEFLINHGIQPNQETLESIFKKMNVPAINTFIKNGIDFSSLKPSGKHSEIINNLQSLGMNTDVLLEYCLDFILSKY